MVMIKKCDIVQEVIRWMFAAENLKSQRKITVHWNTQLVLKVTLVLHVNMIDFAN